MSTYSLPYVPIRQALYSPGELFGQFVEDHPGSFSGTTDFEIYRHFIGTGSASTADPYVAMTRAKRQLAVTSSKRNDFAVRLEEVAVSMNELRAA
jgi:hypothetical protein